MPRINHLSVPTNSKSSAHSSGGNHHSIYRKNYPGSHYYITSQASTAAHHKVTVYHKVHATAKVHHKVIAVIPEIHGEPTTTAAQESQRY
jgi:hypothetical protein